MSYNKVFIVVLIAIPVLTAGLIYKEELKAEEKNESPYIVTAKGENNE